MVLWDIEQKSNKRKRDLIPFHGHRHCVMRGGILDRAGGGQDGESEQSWEQWKGGSDSHRQLQRGWLRSKCEASILSSYIPEEGESQGLRNGNDWGWGGKHWLNFLLLDTSLLSPYFSIYWINFFFQENPNVLCLYRYYRVHFILPWIFISRLYVCHPH